MGELPERSEVLGECTRGNLCLGFPRLVTKALQEAIQVGRINTFFLKEKLFKMTPLILNYSFYALSKQI